MKRVWKIGCFLKLCLLMLFSLGLFGCATLSYVGDDYISANSQTVKTNEDFVFNTYKKTLDNQNIKIGITRTPVAEILAIFVQIENLSYETPYTFYVEDLRAYADGTAAPFVSTNSYLGVWQTQETASMSAIGSVGNTISTLTGMSGSYNEYNQTSVQNHNNQDTQSAFQRIDVIGNQILKHTVRVSTVISPRKSQYFYFFIEDNDRFPIKITYKGLEYQFNL